MFSILGFCLLIMCCEAEKDGVQIVGGDSISITEVPFMAIYRPLIKKFHCGASIISDQLLVSAAHCYNPIYVMEITVGTDKAGTGGLHYEIQDHLIHPLYRKTKYRNDYDVVVIKLKKRLTFSASVAPIDLAEKDISIRDDETFLVTGFGATSLIDPLYDLYGLKHGSNQLLGVEVPHVSLKECRHRLEGSLFVSDQMICAGGEEGKDSCVGDCGGPLILQRAKGSKVLVGIVSSGEGCGTKAPSVYTRVSSVIDFIKQVVRENK